MTKFDLIISDMKRNNSEKAGIELIEELKAKNIYFNKTILSFGNIDVSRPIPHGAFAMTGKPEELINFVFDLVERIKL